MMPDRMPKKCGGNWYYHQAIVFAARNREKDIDSEIAGHNRVPILRRMSDYAVPFGAPRKHVCSPQKMPL